DGSLGLAAPFDFAGQLRVRPGGETDLRRLLAEMKLPIRVEGRLDATADVRGTLNPWKLSASGRAGAADLHVEPVRLERVDFAWTLEPDHLRIRDLIARVSDGTVTGVADIPTDSAAEGSASFTLDRVDASILTRDWRAIPVRLEGRIGGTASARLAGQP